MEKRVPIPNRLTMMRRVSRGKVSTARLSVQLHKLLAENPGKFWSDLNDAEDAFGKELKKARDRKKEVPAEGDTGRKKRGKPVEIEPEQMREPGDDVGKMIWETLKRYRDWMLSEVEKDVLR